MTESPDDGLISFLDRRPPPAFVVRFVAIPPGSRLPCVEDAWRDELVVVECGVIQLDGTGGARRRFVAGDVLCFAGLSLRAVCNDGTEVAIISAVSRAGARA